MIHPGIKASKGNRSNEPVFFKVCHADKKVISITRNGLNLHDIDLKWVRIIPEKAEPSVSKAKAKDAKPKKASPKPKAKRKAKKRV